MNKLLTIVLALALLCPPASAKDQKDSEKKTEQVKKEKKSKKKKGKKEKEKKTLKQEIMSWIWTLIAALVIATVFRA